MNEFLNIDYLIFFSFFYKFAILEMLVMWMIMMIQYVICQVMKYSVPQFLTSPPDCFDRIYNLHF